MKISSTTQTIPPIVTATPSQEEKRENLFYASFGKSALTVFPRRCGGRLAVCITGGSNLKSKFPQSLVCGIDPKQLLVQDTAAEVGDIILAADDVLTPERCAAKGFRSDGRGYRRHLAVYLVDAEGTTVWTISCTQCRRGQDGKLHRVGEYEKVLNMQLSPAELAVLQNAVRDYLAGAQQAQQSAFAWPSRSRPWRGGVNNG